MNQSNQLTSAYGYDTKNMIFSKPIVTNIPGAAISTQRLKISTRNPDGTVGDLIIPTELLHSIGVRPNKPFGAPEDSTKISGYALPVFLHDRDGPTKQQQEFITTVNNIVDRIKNYVFQIRAEIGMADMEMSDLRKINPIYVKKDKITKKPVEGAIPGLFAKLKDMKNKKNPDEAPRILTKLYDINTGDPIDPLKLVDTPCKVEAAIKFDSVFIGSRISIQYHVHEANIDIIENTNQRLLSTRRPTDSNVEVDDLTGISNHRPLPDGDMSDDEAPPKIDVDEDDDDAGSISAQPPPQKMAKMEVDEDDDEDVPPPPAPKEKKIIKKVMVKKKVKEEA